MFAKKALPLWLVPVLLLSGIGVGALAHYVWQSVTIPFEVKEPLQIISYTSELSLFPGETMDIKAIVQNHASINYSVNLDFRLDDIRYQQQFVIFSDEIYVVVPGEQTLNAWVSAKPCAPPISTKLTIEFKRIGPSIVDECAGFEDDFESYAAGTFPYNRGWELWYSGANVEHQVVVDFTSISPTKSLQLLGWGIEEVEHMAAVVAYPFVRSTGTSMVYRLFAMADEVCDFDSSVVVGFGKRTPEGVTRCNEVRFYSDGMIKTMVAGNEIIPLQSYEPDTWYEVEVVLDIATDTFSIWIDGELKGSDFNCRFPSSEIEAFLLTSNYGNVKVYFDDVTICQSARAEINVYAILGDNRFYTEAKLLSLDIDPEPGDQSETWVLPGQSVEVEITCQIWEPRGPSIINQLFIIYSWSPTWPPPVGYYLPLYIGQPGIEGLTLAESFTLTAPDSSGEYYLWFCAAEQYNMEDAINTFAELPTLPAHARIVVGNP